MSYQIFGHWLFLAVLSCFATALLIFLSSEAFGGAHSSVIMAARLIGVAALVIPVLIYISTTGRFGPQLRTDMPYICLIVAVGLCAGVSWYSFYLALEAAKAAEVDSTVVTAINYSSVVVLLALSWALGRFQPDWRNWLGVSLVLVGIVLTASKPPVS